MATLFQLKRVADISDIGPKFTVSNAEYQRGEAKMAKLKLTNKCPDCGAKKIQNPWGNHFENPECEEHQHDLHRWLAVGGSIRTWRFAREWPAPHVTRFTEAVDAWIAGEEWEEGRGLAFFGTPGCGKTSALAYACKVSGLHPAIVKFSELLDSSYDTKPLIDVDILLIDELAAPRTDAQLDYFGQRLHRIVDSRYEMLAPTLITSNISTEEFRAAFPTVTSRLLEQGNVVEDLEAPDFRAA